VCFLDVFCIVVLDENIFYVKHVTGVLSVVRWDVSVRKVKI
jgi:hypothetical protein